MGVVVKVKQGLQRFAGARKRAEANSTMRTPDAASLARTSEVAPARNEGTVKADRHAAGDRLASAAKVAVRATNSIRRAVSPSPSWIDKEVQPTQGIFSPTQALSEGNAPSEPSWLHAPSEIDRPDVLGLGGSPGTSPSVLDGAAPLSGADLADGN